MSLEYQFKEEEVLSTKCEKCGNSFKKNNCLEIIIQYGPIKKLVGYICNECANKCEKAGCFTIH